MDDELTVGALTRRITGDLDAYGLLSVRGELSQARVVASGHFYGTLKDHEAVISIVCWRSTAARLGNKLPREGDEVIARGRLDVYGPRGQYQLVCTGFRPVGAGDLAARFEALKQRLAAEGLFDDERKQPLPFLPHGLGLATAEGSAAEADFLDSVAVRFPDMPITRWPCRVQGQGAAAEIAAALAGLDADPDVAVIVLTRGGGSLEDLWAFNEEAVVRAIAASSKPVISAVGHETDITLADFVADLRAKTPTAAGELVVPVQAEVEEQVAHLRERLDAAIDWRLDELRKRLEALATHRALVTPRHQLHVRLQRLDELQERLAPLGQELVDDARQRLEHDRQSLRARRPHRRVAELLGALPQQQRRLGRALVERGRRCDERFAALVGRLDALSPLAVIGRGYGVLTDASGQVIRSVDQVAPGQPIHARIGDGIVDATVSGADHKRLAEASDIYRAADE